MTRSIMKSLPAAAGLLVACGAAAQGWPAKPVRIIVASTAGGGTDFVARTVAPKLAQALGQQVVVENRPGGGSTIGYDYGIKAAPDGYTLIMITPSYTINPSIYRIKFDALHDFTPVIRVARGPYVIVVHPSLPARSVQELVALAKARPGEITYGTSGTGAIVHLTTELFLYKAGVKMTHVPYKGGSQALVDLVAGQIQVVFATSQTGLAQAKGGRVRALAVTTPERVAAAPELPTVAEAGVPGYEVTNWHALIGPKGLPGPVVERLNGDMNRILRQKAMEELMGASGVSPVGGTTAQLQAQIANEIEQWRGVVERAGVKTN